MKIITIDNHDYVIVGLDENCPICDTPIKQSHFRWSLFHGEADISCCNVSYQVKDWYIEKPSQEMIGFMAKLGKEYIWLKLKPEYIQPLNEALKELNKTKVDEEVVTLAERKVS